LASVLDAAMERIRRCKRCRTLSEQELCILCAKPDRDDSLLCVIEHPSEIVAIEQATDFRGRYFVLGGRLSPLDGVGPEVLGLDLLETQLREREIEELILAISPTVEGSATSHFISAMAVRYQVRTTRIAHGVPLGGELEYVDGGTLAHAFAGRQDIEQS